MKEIEMKGSKEIMKMSYKETKLLKKLKHKNIIKCYGTDF